MNRSWSKRTSWTLAAAATLIAVDAGAWECVDYPSRRLDHFETLARREIARCTRRSDDCPDATLRTRLDALAARIARAITRRCPDVDAGAQLTAMRGRLFCADLGRCAAGSITVRVENDATAGSSALARDAAPPSSRQLRADAGWTGLAHGLQILEGASYTAELSRCGDGDTICDLHGATAGTSFGAPSPLSAGGVAFCLAIGFASDLTGTYDLATGALSEEAQVGIDVSLDGQIDRPCPACVPEDGDPALGEAGTCAGGEHAGAACTVEGFGDPSLGSLRGTSADCGPGRTAIAHFDTHATATTGTFDLSPLPDSPRCTLYEFIGQRCPCSTCNDGATACRSDADCPATGVAPGICGGRYCLEGRNEGQPCSSSTQCPGGFCSTPGIGTAKNACIDQTCTNIGDGQGVCLEGPVDQHCAIAKLRGCATDADCPPGDTCIEENRACHPDALTLVGTPDAPSGGIAHPTLVGGFCMAPARSMAVNVAAGFPGPVTYVWPTAITFGE